MAFQCVAERGGGPAGLEMPVDKKPIQISAAVHVPEADDQVSVQRHQGVVFPQCVVPAGCVHGPGRPGPELFRGVVSGVDRVYGFKKEAGKGFQVLRAVEAQIHGTDSFPAANAGKLHKIFFQYNTKSVLAKPGSFRYTESRKQNMRMMASGETAQCGAEGDRQRNSQAKVPMPDETPKTGGNAGPKKQPVVRRGRGESFR